MMRKRSTGWMVFGVIATGIAVIMGLAGVQDGETDQRNQVIEQLYHYADEITASGIMEKLNVLAHDSLEGRETGTEAEWKTVQFLENHYKNTGLEPCGETKSYLQPVPMTALRTDSLVYEIRFPETTRRSVETGRQSADFLRTFGGTEPLAAEIYFSGFGLFDPGRGIDHLRVKSQDPEGSTKRFVLIFDDLPHEIPGNLEDGRADKSQGRSDGAGTINPSITKRQRDGRILRDPNILGILKISDMAPKRFQHVSELSRNRFAKPENIRPAGEADTDGPARRFPGFVGEIHPEIAAQLLGLASVNDLEGVRSDLIRSLNTFTAEPAGAVLQYTPYEGHVSFNSYNVAACLKGSDPLLHEEAVVIMAHLDHIGIGSPDSSGDTVYNGADDNGSGTSALMTISETFQRAASEGVRPRRTLMFLHVSAEEKGLLGSRYYSENPIIPMEKTVAALNIDMIGRSDARHLKEGITDYVYLIGGEIISSALDRHVVTANEKTSGFLLDDGYNDLTDPNQFYRRSDHWNFGRFGVPFVFFFTGVHEDYHQPGDHADKIDSEKLAGVARIIYGSAIEVANAEERPVVDNQAFIRITRPSE